MALDKALSISSRGILPQHISSYQLSVEPGSMLARMVEKGRWSEASEDVCQEQYSELCSVLASAGLPATDSCLRIPERYFFISDSIISNLV
ncbi:MAG: hypothetical protein IKV05_03340 [Bacteroidales bacterium]|nr:hypothetical protein [Bacteroidales bacterium]